ncbi:FAD-dependent oxidoreductase [Caballeronia sp. DA-9]|uniref:FAD-dependent oxidoreductase n=1 Tax=Caballeronia sp. DA-9 TaxID=3436237 RepID=UPI003F661676
MASEGEAYVPMTRQAYGEWRRLEADSGRPLLNLCGGLYAGPAGSPFMRKIMSNVERYDLRHETLSLADLQLRYPQLAGNDGDIGLFGLKAGFSLAEVAVAVAAETAVKHGGRLVTQTKIRAILPEDKGVRIITDDDMWMFDKVVIATGAWLNELLPKRIPYVDVQRLSVHWCPLRDASVYQPERFPIFEIQGKEFLFAVWPSIDQATIKVGFAASIGHLASAQCMTAGLSDEVLALTDDYVRRYLPGAIPVAIRHAVCMDGFTADRDFLLGPLLGDARLIVFTGISGHGFKMASALGLAASQWALAGGTELDYRSFDPERFPARRMLSRAYLASS